MERPSSIRILPDDWLGPLKLEEHFPAGQPLEVDVGCGKGRFLLARAAAHPEIAFLGLDRMLRRIRKIDRKAVRAGVFNVRLIRVEAYYATLYLIPPARVSTFYVFFPDPWPKKRHHKYRLFNEPYLDALHRDLVPGGRVHLATDHQPYFDEIRPLFLRDPRWEDIEPFEPTDEERTEFEMYYRQHTTIWRCSFRKRDNSLIG